MQNLFLSFFLLFFSTNQSFQWVSFEMTTRSAKDGKTVKIDARVSCKSTGDMVTHFLKPTNVYVLNNKLGELQIYNVEANEVVRSLDNRLGSQNSTFYYFLQGNTSDLGLEDSGFLLKDSRVEGMLLITEYATPDQNQGDLSYVELVSNGEYPVFMGYVSKEGKYIKKIYYYDYDFVAGANFPMTITEIDFMKGDSSVSKTTFANFRFDHPEDKTLADFQVPSNATLLK